MINILCIIFFPLLFLGLIHRVKAIMVGRKGKSIWQNQRDFLKLLQKDEVLSVNATIISRIAPVLSLAATITAALFVPFLSARGVLSFQGDFIFMIYLLTLSKGIMALAAMDSGSSFQGMGTSRELSFTSFLEPAFFLIIAALIISVGSGSLSSIFALQNLLSGGIWNAFASLFIAIALYIILLVESCRVPFDDPTTHLELTMIHEVMVLDYSGFSLAVIHYTSALKMFIYASLISHLIIPAGGSFLWYLLILAVVYIFTGVLESLMARFRMNRNLELVLVPLSIALLTLTVLLAINMGVW
ncbi:MAG: NADH-quinone oxidoreductase subunit H [Candidatus Cloacimonetes bacterium]|jgi:formate hydrogenlyase subunit 4|nr:NADH-quinone oxidoreductase subunit H [Candidatus Cloacimonadota bacterium]MDY0325762.1 NADH-quinone oxidoreductase subunit H [Candidatus Cloacimonadaceae bacterium]